MSYVFSKQARDAKFAGGGLRIRAEGPGEEEISFFKEGKTRWHAMVPTVHGRSGMFREHRHFPLSQDHVLVASYYEHSRGGHTNSMVSVCNTRGVSFTERIDPLTPFLIETSGSRALTVLMLEEMPTSSKEPDDAELLLGYQLRVFGLGKRAERQRIPLRAKRNELREVFHLTSEELVTRERRFPLRFEEKKSGAKYIQIRSPFPERSHGRLQLNLDELRREASKH